MQLKNRKIKFSFFLTGVLFVGVCCFVQCQSKQHRLLPALSAVEIDSLQKHYAQKLQKILLKSPSLHSQIKIDAEGIHIFAPKANEAECQLTWEALPLYLDLLQKAPLYLQEIYPQLPQVAENIKEEWLQDFPAFQPETPQPLKGWRIALDPGHFAGNMTTAMMEGKFINLTNAEGTKISFFESELAWFTARMLADELERLGASVLLSRNQYGHTAFDETYEAWYHQFIQTQLDSGKATAKLSPQQAFYQYFRKIEFEQRTQKINQFRPHLTLIIHYNVDATNTQWKKTTPRNNSMAFVGGAFMQNELDKSEARFHLLRLLLTDSPEQSIAFSDALLQSVNDSLGVVPIGEPNEQFFLKENCLQSDKKGVYCRNLTLARTVMGTLSYLEPLYQDNEQEAKLLHTRDFDYQGRKLPRRIYEVALAYKAGVLKYLSSK